MKIKYLYHSLLACGFLALLTACASNPTGGANFVLMSESAELSTGRELHEQLIKDTPIYNDPELQAYVEEIGQKMAAISHRPELDYTFTIIDSPEINAYALPGGYVYINRGLMLYLTTEAQLAAVLGHEIGHITARHAVRQQTTSRATNVVSTVLVIATGATSLMDTASLFGGALLSGYGRDMELEADSLGAEYLFKAGYNPNAMVEVITVLKNHEDFTKRTSNQGVAYHGLFSSHPRNDARLKGVVEQAGELTEEQQIDLDPAVYRNHMDGLLVGQSIQVSVGNSEARNRYYQNLLEYTIVFPNDWEIQETTTTATANSDLTSAHLNIMTQRRQESKEPRLYIRENLGIADLRRTEALSQFGLSGYTGVKADTNERIAVIYYGPRVYVFTGVYNADSPENTDELLLSSIKSFRPIANNERGLANPVLIEYIRSDGRSYAELARDSRLPQFPEDYLRLYNADYPSGEPQAGEWIKVAN